MAFQHVNQILSPICNRGVVAHAAWRICAAASPATGCTRGGSNDRLWGGGSADDLDGEVFARLRSRQFSPHHPPPEFPGRALAGVADAVLDQRFGSQLISGQAMVGLGVVAGVGQYLCCPAAPVSFFGHRRKVGIVWYWGEDCSGWATEYRTIRISPENEVVERGSSFHTFIFGPRSTGPNMTKRTILWSTGRFYSSFIERVTGVIASLNGRILVTASGKIDDRPGRWELQIEPDAAWMVREARFWANAAPGIVACEMKNSGTIRTGGFVMPQSARFSYTGPVDAKGQEADTLSFDAIEERFDAKLYAAAQHGVTTARPPGLELHDYRVSSSVPEPGSVFPLASPSLDDLAPPTTRQAEAPGKR